MWYSFSPVGHSKVTTTNILVTIEFAIFRWVASTPGGVPLLFVASALTLSGRPRVLTFLLLPLIFDLTRLTVVVQYPCCKLRPGSSRGVSVFGGTGTPACALFRQ